MHSEFTPAAKTNPSGSYAATGRPDKCIRPWQFGDLKSHSLRVLSKDPERKVSSTGDKQRDTTFFVCPGKYLEINCDFAVKKLTKQKEEMFRKKTFREN